MNDLRRILFLFNEVVNFRFIYMPLEFSDLVVLYLHELELYARSKIKKIYFIALVVM